MTPFNKWSWSLWKNNNVSENMIKLIPKCLHVCITHIFLKKLLYGPILLVFTKLRNCNFQASLQTLVFHHKIDY